VAWATIILTLPWYTARARWLSRAIREGVDHRIVVDPGPDGRPGERLTAPTRSLYRPRVVPGARNDFCVFLDRKGTSLQGVCLGRVEDRGDPEASAHETVEHFAAKGWIALKAMASEQIGGAEAFRYWIAHPGGSLTEWKFAYDGWLYAVGAFHRGRDEDATIARARAALASWEWIAPAEARG
jgi:hypothetical protein